MVEERKHKCYFNKDGNFEICEGLSKVLVKHGRIGLSVPQFCDLSKGVFNIEYGVTLKYDKKEKAIFFNFCPFCGEKILNEKNKLNTNKIPYYGDKD